MTERRIVVSAQDAFERILVSLYDAMLDDTHWPATSALIDEACGITGNTLLVGEGPKDDVRARFIGAYYRGQRREDLEREYLEVYHPIDERVPRVRQLPDSRLVSLASLYTAEELKTSPAYNEILPRGHYQDGLNVRLDASEGSWISWGVGARNPLLMAARSENASVSSTRAANLPFVVAPKSSKFSNRTAVATVHRPPGSVNSSSP